MDYDDNDFQGQNLQLAGERDIKYSSIIRPYALPKFDLDESLQEHLRFESLVGTEVFLSIDSQESNNWIGDFSRCSSGISFCPGGADSCSISRQNHAWSEAASPESVEMLLKSVGQEEMNQGQTFNDPCNELIDIPKGVGPTFNQGDVILYKVGDSVESRLTVQSENFGCLSKLSGATASEAFQSEGIGQINKCDSYVFRSLNNCSFNSHRDKCFLLDAEECYLDCNDLKDGELVFPPPCDTTVNEVEDLSSTILSNNSLTVNDISASRNAFLNDTTNTEKLVIQEVSSFGITENANILGVQVCEVGDLDIPPVKIIDEKLIVDTNESSESFDIQDCSNIKGNILEIGGAINESPTVMVHTNWEINPEISERSPCFGKVGEWKGNIYDNKAVVCGHEIRNVGTIASSCIEIVNFSDCQAKGNEDPIRRNTTVHNEHFVSSSEVSLLETDDTNDCGLRGETCCSKEVDEPCSASTSPQSSISKEPDKIEELKNFHGYDKDLDDVAKTQAENVVPDAIASTLDIDNPVDEDHNVLLPMTAQTPESLPVDDANKNEGCNNSTMDDFMVQESGISKGPEHMTSQHQNLTDVTSVHEVVSDEQIGLQTLDESEQSIIVTTEIVTVNITDESLVASKNNDSNVCSQPPIIENEYSQKAAEEVDVCSTVYLTTKSGDYVNSVDPHVNENTEELNAKSLCEEDLPVASGDSEYKIELEQADVVSSIKICEVADIGAIDKDDRSASSDGQCLDTSSSRKDEDTDNVYQKTRPTQVCEEDIKLSSHGNGKECSDPDKSNCESPSIIICSENPINEKRMQENINVIVNQNVPFVESNEAFREQTCCILPDAGAVDSSVDDRSFTFEVTPLADTSGNGITTVWQPFSVQTGKTSEVVDGSNRHLKVAEDTSELTSLNPSQKTSCDDDFQRTIVSKGDITPTISARESSKKASLVKESEKADKSCESSPLVVLIGQSEGFSCMSRTSVSPSAIASNLPDLNATAFPSIVFQQPFTDLQQVQLRAQILVYGSLMQGSIPDEAWMSSAFGVSDGGRKYWEKIWHVSIERFHDQNAQSPNPETPMQSTLGTPPTDPPGRHSTFQSKIASSHISQSGNKSISISGKSMPAIPSPLWSISARLDGLQSNVSRGMTVDYPPIPSPSRPYRSPPIRNFIPHSSSWTCPSVFQVPWITSQHTSLPDSSTCLPKLHSPEIVRLSPTKELPVLSPHSVKLVSSCAGTSGITESVFVGNMVPLDTKRGIWTPNRLSIESKSRKKKKTPISEDISPVYPTEAESVIGRSMNILPSSSHIHTTPISTSEKVITIVSPPLITSTVKSKEPEIDQGVTLSEESLNKVKEAKQQAEEAAAHADAAVCHTQYMWSQLDKKKNFGLLSNVEAEIAGAAATIAAAASIAKAAAAAAKIASNAAFHAKLMVDEAFISSGNGNTCQSCSFSDSMSCLGKVSASSVIVAAKEAAQRKIEAASAASKRAENLDAVIKAAELAAEAISQAGKIVTMGDPLPLADLVKAGPDGFWKLPGVSSELNIPHRGLLAGENADCQQVVSRSSCKVSEKDTQLQYIKNRRCSGETSGDTEDHASLVDANSVSAEVCDGNLDVRKDNEVNKLSETTFDHVRGSGVFKLETIKEGTAVEVFKDDEGCKAAWFLAEVVGLEDGNALVCYNEAPAMEGSGLHKEWVSFVFESDKAPRVRVARPTITSHLDGTRKRSRTTMCDIVWSVGDRVDAWINNSWWEGVIREKRDELAFFVHFPANEETSVVGVWLLRPSLIWNNGEWVEQSLVRGNSHLEGDAQPKEKRMRLLGPTIEPPIVDTSSKNVHIVEADNHGGSSLVNLSSLDEVFAIGKNYRDIRSRNTHKIMRSNSQKEGLKATFGFPKTGKKRKLVEVSKNYVANQSTRNPIVNDSAKLAKFFTPMVDGSLNSLRRDFKEKRASDTRTKVLRPVKTQTDYRTLNDNLPTSSLSTSQRGIVIDNFENFKNFKSGEENTTVKHNVSKLRSFPGGSSKGPVLFSQSSNRSESASCRKVSEHGNVNKSGVPPGKKLAKIEEEKVLTSDVEKSVSELTEPRRSNRRIQPTSRMLEGLQSSLNMPKLAPVSHDRSHRNGTGRSTSSSRSTSSNRNISRGGGRE